jgi:cytochrome c-type biogenesis protein CcmH
MFYRRALKAGTDNNRIGFPMVNFWIIAAALIIAALVLVLVPLARAKGNRTVLMSLVGLAILVPVATIGLYTLLTTQNWDAPEVAVAAESGPPVEEMITQLEARLEDGSGSVDEYLMLGRSYVTLQRFPDAVSAYSEAWNLSNNESVEAALGLGESMTYVNRDALLGEAGELVEWSLAQDPENPRALWFGGLVSLARGNEQQAADRWTILLRYQMPDQLRAVIQQQLAVLPPASEAVMAAAQPAEAISIDITIDVSNELKAAAADGTLVYVFVREPGKAGPPLAVTRLAPVLPISVRLSDANVMIPGSTLAGKPELQISARVSMSGDPIAAPGDLEGIASWDQYSGLIKIVVDSVVE